MKIVIAPDSFKNCMASPLVASAVAIGVHRVCPEAHLELIPLADGGEGSLDAVAAALHGEFDVLPVSGPLGLPVPAKVLRAGTLAVVEIAQAAGLELLRPEQYDPCRTTTFGVGQLIRHELDAGIRDFLITLGGSATCDGGIGMLQALGARFRLDDGSLARQPLAGGDLEHIAEIDLAGLPAALSDCRFRIACDVSNPLTGELGAAAVFAPQKGASPEVVRSLESGMCRYRNQLRAVGVDSPDSPGDGAAGGLGFAFRAVLHGSLEPGAALIADLIHFESRLAGAQLVITGEGRSDHQTLHGKLCAFVAAAARRNGVPVALVSGAIAAGEIPPGFADFMKSVSDPALPLAENIRRAPEFLADAGDYIARCFLKIR